MLDDRPVAETLASYLTDPNGIALPELSSAEDAASHIIALYEQSGRTGATFSLRFGDMSGQPLYSVSLWPECEEKFTGALSSRILQVFITQNLHLLDDPRCGVGLWYNAEDNVTYRDIVAFLSDRQEAIDLAIRYSQIAIFDLQTLTEIETGGTGNISVELLPVAERLPKGDFQEEEI
jgi:hypothetical protein